MCKEHSWIVAHEEAFSVAHPDDVVEADNQCGRRYAIVLFHRAKYHLPDLFSVSLLDPVPRSRSVPTFPSNCEGFLPFCLLISFFERTPQLLSVVAIPLDHIGRSMLDRSHLPGSRRCAQHRRRSVRSKADETLSCNLDWCSVRCVAKGTSGACEPRK